jgi:hypothetical protein
LSTPPTARAHDRLLAEGSLGLLPRPSRRAVVRRFSGNTDAFATLASARASRRPADRPRARGIDLPHRRG